MVVILCALSRSEKSRQRQLFFTGCGLEVTAQQSVLCYKIWPYNVWKKQALLFACAEDGLQSRNHFIL